MPRNHPVPRVFYSATMNTPAVSAAVVFLSSVLTTDALANWPQWRGPTSDGVAAADATPPLKWSESEGLKWKLKLPGFGTSTPVVWGDLVFVTTAISAGEKPATPPPSAPPAEGERRRGGGGFNRSEKPSEAMKFDLLAVDRTTGKVRWQKTAVEAVPHEGAHRDHGYASFSAVTDGEHVYAYFGSRGLFCYDMAGELKWKKDFGDMQTRNSFGEGGSPALHGDSLVIAWDTEGTEDFIVSLDKKTGNEQWRKSRDEATNWTTPLVVAHGGKSQVVVNGTNRIRSYDLATGEQLWECAGMTTNSIPTPVAADGILYATSGFRGAALLALKLGKTGDLTDSDSVVWNHAKATPYVPSPLVAGGRLWFFSGNTGILSCFDAKTGKPFVEAERIPDLLGGVYASPVAAAGRVYLVGRDGKVVVLSQSDKIEVLAVNSLEDRFDASAAMVGKQLFLRGHQSLYCIGE
jgi:outer membrane protein assembly factor BamB